MRCILVRYESVRDKKEQSQAWVDKQVARMRRGMTQMAAELGERSWCSGDRYPLADIALGCCLGWLDFRKPGVCTTGTRSTRRSHKHYLKLMERAPPFADTIPQAPK